MKIVQEKQNNVYSLDTKELSFNDVGSLNNPIAKKIISKLKVPMYPKSLAKEIGVHEQKIYYHIKKLEKGGIIEVVNQVSINGTIANYYQVSSKSFFFKVEDFKETTNVVQKQSVYLKPFIENGNLNALIIVGSPDPHGPLKARSRDGYFGMDLALFLGTFLNYMPESRVKLDTEVTEKDLEANNLIVIGGPIVNKVSGEVNNNLKIYFDEDKKGIYSKLSKKTYHDEGIGYINKLKNPYNNDKALLLIAGLRNSGTKAAILAFLKHFDELKKGNSYKNTTHSRVVEGLDLNSDGVVDDCEFLE